MGLAEYLEGAPKPDPQFIRPPEEEEIYDPECLVEDYRRSGRSLKFAIGTAGFVLAGSVVMVAVTMSEYNSHNSADAQQSPSAHETPESTSPTPSPTPTKSPSPSPSFSATPTVAAKRHIAHSPSHIPSPSVTESKKVTLSPTQSPTPTPSPETSATVPTAACSPNENAPGEVVCSSPVNAYKDGFSNEVVFQINGGAAPNCANIQGGRVEVAVANAVGFANLVELGDPC